jgi:hypothetical protein
VDGSGIVEHPDVRMISLRRLDQHREEDHESCCGKQRVHLELGQAPIIVFDDADPELVRKAPWLQLNTVRIAPPLPVFLKGKVKQALVEAMRNIRLDCH